MFESQLPNATLAIICRKLGTMLESGVDVQRAFRLAAKKAGDRNATEAMEGVCDAIDRGDEITEGMRQQGEVFPTLVIDMVAVGEQTGNIAEILKSLAGHYDNLVRLRRTFWRNISWPLFQLIAAILVVAVTIWILGIIADSKGGPAMTFLPGGLSGTEGALTWLGFCGGTAVIGFISYQIISRSLKGKKTLHGVLMRIPAIRGCMQSLAIARFSWAFSLTQQSGMPVRPSLQASLRATNNGVYEAAYPRVWAAVQAGESLSWALRDTRLFPEEFIEMVLVAEESGTVPEMLDHLSPQFEDDARRALQTLSSILAKTIYALVAVFIIFLIFRIFSLYLGAINNALEQTR